MCKSELPDKSRFISDLSAATGDKSFILLYESTSVSRLHNVSKEVKLVSWLSDKYNSFSEV